jgi:hypothetical protein
VSTEGRSSTGNKNMSTCKLRREASGETNPADTFILNLILNSEDKKKYMSLTRRTLSARVPEVKNRQSQIN